MMVDKPPESWYIKHIGHAELTLTRRRLAYEAIEEQTTDAIALLGAKQIVTVASQHLDTLRASYVEHYFVDKIAGLFEI